MKNGLFRHCKLDPRAGFDIRIGAMHPDGMGKSLGSACFLCDKLPNALTIQLHCQWHRKHNSSVAWASRRAGLLFKIYFKTNHLHGGDAGANM